ncbi:MAG: hypothetical protein C4293_03195 [Nitrospiraceae bacterium]
MVVDDQPHLGGICFQKSLIFLSQVGVQGHQEFGYLAFMHNHGKQVGRPDRSRETNKSQVGGAEDPSMTTLVDNLSIETASSSG